MPTNMIDAAHDVLHTAPVRLSQSKGGATTAFYEDVALQDLPATTKLTPMPFGYAIQGEIGECHFAGQAVEGSTSGVFRRVVLSFTGPEPTIH
jgi:hypothetical protein